MTTAAPVLRLADPQALVGADVVDPRRGPVGTVAGVLASGRRLESLLVRRGDGGTERIEETRVLGFDGGRVLVRGSP